MAGAFTWTHQCSAGPRLIMRLNKRSGFCLGACSACMLVLLLPACVGLTGDGYRKIMAEYFSPATLEAENLSLKFSQAHVRVRASFFFVNHAPARITCRFPGAGYPVCHGVPNIPARLGISPKDVRIRVISGPEMDPARVPTNSVPLRCIHEGGREVIEFVVDFTNRHTRVDVSYTSPWQSLDDGLRTGPPPDGLRAGPQYLMSQTRRDR